jgi:2-polyprenyl-3-methyl-5-hydroxy-6-metoxy-1,4-benzoquinol methylase
MATPEAYEQALFDFAGLEIAHLVRTHVSPDMNILDIGAGWGKYKILLPEYQMDAVEVWTPYIEQNRLDAIYANIFNGNVADYDWPRLYGVIIFGDVLEHIPVPQAQHAIQMACQRSAQVLVATPFEMPQCAVDGNSHEEHVQEDLTKEVMAQRYPELMMYKTRVREGEHTKAIYVKRDSI